MSSMLAELGFAARILLGAAFLVAALGKIRAAGTFVTTVGRLGILSQHALLIARGLVVCEGVVGILFLVGLLPIITVVTCLVLLALFAGAAVIALRSHRNIPCSCFGSTETPLGWHTLLRVALFALPLSLYSASARIVGRVWWPTQFDKFVLSLSLVLAALILASWLSAVPTVVDLVRERHRMDVHLQQKVGRL